MILLERYKKASFLVFALGFFILATASFYHLSESPGIWFDEGMYTQVAMNLATYGVEGIQTAPGEFASAGSVTGGFPFLAPVALSYKFFGIGVMQGRAVMAIFILLFATASFFFIRSLFGTWQGSLALLLLASFAMLYGNGKSVLGEVPGLFFLVCALLALRFFERRSYRGIWSAVAVGLLTGLCIATKPIFILLLPAFAIVWLIRRREVTVHIREFFFGLLAFLVPLITWLYFQFGVGDTVLHLLSFYANPYSVSDLPTLVTGNIMRFVTDVTALYTLVLLAVWGMALIMRRQKREPISIAEISAFLFALIIIIASFRLPGWNRYISPATTIALIFFPYSFLYIFNHARKRISILASMPLVPYALLALMFLGQMYQIGFSSYVANYYHAHRTRDLQEAFASLAPSASIFVYNAPEVVVILPSSNYYQYIKPYADNDEALMGANQLRMLLAGGVDYVIIGTNDLASSSPFFAGYQFVKKVNRYSLFAKK